MTSPEINKKKMDKKVKKILELMTTHGEECGTVIAEYLRKRYPRATVFNLYRSAIAFEKDEGDKTVKFYACGDPHCMGEEVNEKTLASWTREWIICGQRFGPELIHFLGETVSQRIQL